MMEMTMDFPVKDTNDLTGISPGDEVTFILVVDGEKDWVENFHRIGHLALPTKDPTTQLTAQVPELKKGDALPNDEIVTEAGRRVRFSHFHGMAVAFTFFFTRCPLPDFCPRMNKNLSETRQLLLSSPGAVTNWELLSISFDPDFDTPTTLANYALAYRGTNAAHWLFAFAPALTLSDLAPRLDLMVMRQGGNISHNLRTVVLDPQGRIYRLFDGNQWTPRELADAILEAARLSEPRSSNPISISPSQLNP